ARRRVGCALELCAVDYVTTFAVRVGHREVKSKPPGVHAAISAAPTAAKVERAPQAQARPVPAPPAEPEPEPERGQVVRVAQAAAPVVAAARNNADDDHGRSAIAC